MELTAYKNGQYIPLSQCTVAAMDLGVVNGASVTDMVRTVHQEPFRLEDHVDRFYRAAKNAYLTIPVSKEETCEITRKLFKINGELYPECELAVAYYITPGVNAVYAGNAAKAGAMTPTYIQHVFPLPFTSWKNFYIDGLDLATPSVPHLPPECVSPQGKHRNRLHMWIGDHQLPPGKTGLYLNQQGFITETGGSNFVIYRNNTVISPQAKDILWGVSLQTVKELAEKMGMKFEERDITIFDAVNAEEAWVTTTPYCVAPVASLNDQKIGDGSFKVWRSVLNEWSKLVNKDLYQEITESEPIRYR